MKGPKNYIKAKEYTERHAISQMQKKTPFLNRQRKTVLIAALTYLIWWFLVEIFLTGAFNPLGSRLAIVAFCLLVFAGTFIWPKLANHPWLALLLCASAITSHYFYLLHQNPNDLNWIVGGYILAIAVNACFSSMTGLVIYSLGVFALSILISWIDRPLFETVFLPGMTTILILDYFSLRARLRLVRQSQEQAQQFESLFDAAFEGVAVHDDGILLEVNESLARIFGYERAELLGRNVSVLSTPESQGLVENSSENENENRYQAKGLRKDGTIIDVEISAKQLALQDHTVRLLTVQDITERKKSERNRILYEAAEEALKIRDEFISIVSHELKTPLTNIKLQTQMAQRSFAKGDTTTYGLDRMRRFVEQTDRQADRLTLLVEDMLDISRISTGKLQMQKEKLDLSALCRDVVQSLADALVQAGCSVHIEAEHEVWAWADRFRIEQLVANFLTNAMKYGEGLPILVFVQRHGNEVKIAVQDQGMGIAPENQSRIFQRFERAVSAKNISGLGLGLYICKQIVEAHGGRIEVESALGAGARFTAMFPRWHKESEKEPI